MLGIIAIGIVAIVIILISAYMLFFATDKTKKSLKESWKKIVVVATATSVASTGMILLPQDLIDSMDAILIDSYDIYNQYGYNCDKIEEPYLYESEVLTEGHLPLVIDLKLNDAYFQNSKEFLYASTKFAKNFNDIDFSYNILINETYVKQIPVTVKTEVAKKVNDTIIYETEYTKTYEEVTDYRYVWKPITSEKELIFSNNNIVIIDIVGNFKAQTGHREIDIIPNFRIKDEERSFEKYAWWNSNWERRYTLTTDSNQVSTSLTDYPVLVLIDDVAEMSGHVQADLGDIAFVDEANVTQFDHDIEIGSDSGGVVNASIWVEIPVLYSDSNLHFNMYFSNDACDDQWDIEGTWNSDYLVVFHMSDDSTTIDDRTSNKLNGTIGGNNDVGYNKEGKVGNCISFDGNSNDYLDILSATAFDWTNTDDFTVEQLLIFNTTSSAARLWITCDPSDSKPRVTGYQNALDKIGFDIVLGGGTESLASTDGTFTSGIWNKIEYVYDDGPEVQRIYFNSCYQTNVNPIDSFDCSASDRMRLYLDRQAANYPFDGYADEFRISMTTRNESWLNVNYNTIWNQSQDALTPFITFGPLETNLPSEPDYIVNVSTNGTSFFCFRGDNTTAANFSSDIPGFDDPSESISVWKNDTWDEENWLWQMYYGDGSGVDFELNKFDVVRIILLDEVGNVTIPMNTTGACCCSRTVYLRAGGLNRGYNYTCLCIDPLNASVDNLSDIANFIDLDNFDIVSMWNPNSRKWVGHIQGFTWNDYDTATFRVFETKIASDKTWVME